MSAPTRIVIADDQEAIRHGFRLVPDARPDMQVVGEAGDGETAVALARRARADVVLADIRMPRLDGLEVTRRLAGPGVEDPIRVIVVTTFDLDEYAWIPVLGGERVRPKLVIAALLVPTLILTWRASLHLKLMFDGFRITDDVTGVPPWSLWAQAGLVWIWGVSLAAALLAYHRATRTRARRSVQSRETTLVRE